MKRSQALLILVPALLSALVLACTAYDTRVEAITETASDATVEAMTRAPFLVGPIAVLLFAFGIHQAARRRLVPALVALPALPIWSLIFVELPSFSGGVLWTAVLLAPLRGIQPFGAPPA